MPAEKLNYHVVFRGIGGDRSNHPGVITWTSFESEADFEEWMKTADNEDEILAQGVSQEEAIGYTRQLHQLPDLRRLWRILQLQAVQLI